MLSGGVQEHSTSVGAVSLPSFHSGTGRDLLDHDLQRRCKLPAWSSDLAGSCMTAGITCRGERTLPENPRAKARCRAVRYPLVRAPRTTLREAFGLLKRCSCPRRESAVSQSPHEATCVASGQSRGRVSYTRPSLPWERRRSVPGRELSKARGRRPDQPRPTPRPRQGTHRGTWGLMGPGCRYVCGPTSAACHGLWAWWV